MDQGLVLRAPMEGVGRNSLLVKGSLLRSLLNGAAEYRTDQPTAPWKNGGTNALSHHSKTWNISAAVLCVSTYPHVCFCMTVKPFTLIMCLKCWRSTEVLQNDQLYHRIFSSCWTSLCLFMSWLPSQTLCSASSLGQRINWKQHRMNCLSFVFQNTGDTTNHHVVLAEDVVHQWVADVF